MPFLSLADTDLYYEHSGSESGALPLVFIHGAFCTHADWSPLVEVVGSSAEVVVFDLRGHGASVAPPETCTIEQFADDLHALIEALGVGPAVLVGHSIGARVALAAAAAHPGDAAAVVLVDTSRMFGPGPLPPGETAAELSDDDLMARVSNLVDDIVGPFAEDAIREQVSTTMRSAPVGLVRAVFATWQAWDVGVYDEVLATLEPGLPILAVQSTYVTRGVKRSSLTPETESTPFLDDLRTHLPWVESVILPCLGHFCMLEAPEDVARAVQAFVSPGVR
jgi:pimeloyl-ACP methyl ester carboxylesterase